jgi:hypothetical protein
MERTPARKPENLGLRVKGFVGSVQGFPSTFPNFRSFSKKMSAFEERTKTKANEFRA